MDKNNIDFLDNNFYKGQDIIHFLNINFELSKFEKLLRSKIIERIENGERPVDDIGTSIFYVMWKTGRWSGVVSDCESYRNGSYIFKFQDFYHGLDELLSKFNEQYKNTPYDLSLSNAVRYSMLTNTIWKEKFGYKPSTLSSYYHARMLWEQHPWTYEIPELKEVPILVRQDNEEEVVEVKEISHLIMPPDLDEIISEFFNKVHEELSKNTDEILYDIKHVVADLNLKDLQRGLTNEIQSIGQDLRSVNWKKKEKKFEVRLVNLCKEYNKTYELYERNESLISKKSRLLDRIHEEKSFLNGNDKFIRFEQEVKDILTAIRGKIGNLADYHVQTVTVYDSHYGYVHFDSEVSVKDKADMMRIINEYLNRLGDLETRISKHEKLPDIDMLYTLLRQIKSVGCCIDFKAWKNSTVEYYYRDMNRSQLDSFEDSFYYNYESIESYMSEVFELLDNLNSKLSEYIDKDCLRETGNALNELYKNNKDVPNRDYRSRNRNLIEEFMKVRKKYSVCSKIIDNLEVLMR